MIKNDKKYIVRACVRVQSDLHLCSTCTVLTNTSNFSSRRDLRYMQANLLGCFSRTSTRYFSLESNKKPIRVRSSECRLLSGSSSSLRILYPPGPIIRGQILARICYNGHKWFHTKSVMPAGIQAFNLIHQCRVCNDCDRY